ncbi:hypothetical protein BCR33DRAFT_671429 [Rhizoclosmatium globosum]|uniref:NADH-ubiquinone oxidoreductase chain 2 n=1 Tax=Rhizoclosmatium globosum TaxID=329046 RepID=A0A1Y2AFZ8_9FUNG|nr:hypothetical protein BCR33DRAFT_671429 [Rhizoclosmatium globosum]|eukprot:ORY21210.1 hypothetical protein BCR33DRAFT_671429 [Rhizoclosmatium globosum]
MILGIGLLTSAYGSFLAMPTGIRSTNQGGLLMIRTISLILVASIIFEISTLLHLPDNSICVFMDGTIKLSAQITYLLIFIQTIAIIILQFGVEGGTGAQLSRISGEVFLVMLVNLVALIYVLVGIDWLVTVVAWELFNLSLYLLVSMQRPAGSKEISLSASVKYFLLSAYTTSFLLLSIALLYGLTGTTSYDGLIMIVQTGEVSLWPFYLMMLTFLFKLGAAPLHGWAPDLYDSLPTYTTMFLLIVPKSAVLFLLLQLDYVIGSEYGYNLLLVVGAISMIVGSLGLSSQWRIKRFLAYSSIANLGFILVTINHAPSYYFYIIVYMVSTLVIFGIILSISSGHNIEYISDLSGLYSRNPALAYALAICFFSLAGTPPLIGFFPKLVVILNLLEQGYFAILAILVISSILSCCNYLSVIFTIHLGKDCYKETIVISYRNAIIISAGVGLLMLPIGLYNLVDVLCYFNHESMLIIAAIPLMTPVKSCKL